MLFIWATELHLYISISHTFTVGDILLHCHDHEKMGPIQSYITIGNSVLGQVKCLMKLSNQASEKYTIFIFHLLYFGYLLVTSHLSSRQDAKQFSGALNQVSLHDYKSVGKSEALPLFFYSDYTWSLYFCNIDYVTGLRDPGAPTLPRELFCQFAQAAQAVCSQLTEDAGEHLCQLLGLSVACNGEGVGW